MGSTVEAEVTIRAEVNGGDLEWAWSAYIPLSDDEGHFFLTSLEGFDTPGHALTDARRKLDKVASAGGPERTHFLELNYPKEN